jgi:membrane protein implicated in regulation of membrane protease activity
MKQNYKMLLTLVIGTLGQDIIVAIFLFLLLPRLGINLSLWLKIAVLSTPVVWSAVTYRPYRKILERPSVHPKEAVVGRRGIALSRLDPEGLVRIEGETWKAVTRGDDMDTGTAVRVEEAHGLKLLVSRKQDDKG